MYIQSPSVETRKYFRNTYKIPKLNFKRFEKYASDKKIDLKDINIEKLFTDFKLRVRHLSYDNLSNLEKKKIGDKIPAINNKSSYQQALYAMTIFLCKFDRNIASAILYCFARVSIANIRGQLNKLC